MERKRDEEAGAERPRGRALRPEECETAKDREQDDERVELSPLPHQARPEGSCR